jgi:hypothetical protein
VSCATGCDLSYLTRVSEPSGHGAEDTAAPVEELPAGCGACPPPYAATTAVMATTATATHSSQAREPVVATTSTGRSWNHPEARD